MMHLNMIAGEGGTQKPRKTIAVRGVRRGEAFRSNIWNRVLLTGLWHCNAERLMSKGHKVSESTDAGRYLCNYLYFSSLRQVQAACSSAKQDWHALFVHVPTSKACEMSEQVKFAQDLIEELRTWFQTRRQPGSEYALEGCIDSSAKSQAAVAAAK